MPHMYHMTFTENLNPRSLVSASWGLPLYLLLMSLAVPLILWAGLKLGVSTNPEYFTLGLGIAAQSETLALLAFVGGLSASRADHRQHPRSDERRVGKECVSKCRTRWSPYS